MNQVSFTECVLRGNPLRIFEPVYLCAYMGTGPTLNSILKSPRSCQFFAQVSRPWTHAYWSAQGTLKRFKWKRELIFWLYLPGLSKQCVASLLLRNFCFCPHWNICFWKSYPGFPVFWLMCLDPSIYHPSTTPLCFLQVWINNHWSMHPSVQPSVNLRQRSASSQRPVGSLVRCKLWEWEVEESGNTLVPPIPLCLRWYPGRCWFHCGDV